MNDGSKGVSERRAGLGGDWRSLLAVGAGAAMFGLASPVH